MVTVSVSVSFSCDSDGFISRQCAACDIRFKAAADGSLAHCPFCGRQGDRWETTEQIEYGQAYAVRQVAQPELDKLDSAFRDLARAGATVTGRRRELQVPPKPVERLEEMPDGTTLACCNQVVRHDPQHVVAYCAACGIRSG